jgi:acyl carrier protein
VIARRLVAAAAAVWLVASGYAQSADAIERRVRAVTSLQLGVESKNIEPTRRLSDYGMDELDLVEFVMSLEEEFGISIPDDALKWKKSKDWMDAITVRRLTEIVDERLNAKKKGS